MLADIYMMVSEVKKCINSLESIDSNLPSAYAKAMTAFLNLGRLPFLILDMPNLPINVFHARTHTENNFFSNFSDISLPPKNAVKSFARCNIPGQSIFYCSDSTETCYSELLNYWIQLCGTDNYLYVTISHWIISNSLKILLVTSPYEQDRLSKFDKLLGPKFDHFLNQYYGEFKEALILLYKYLFDKFRKPAKEDRHTYIITASYCNLAFQHKKLTIDGILYPSVSSASKGGNFAIKADYPFNENIKLKAVGRDSFRRTDNSSLPNFDQVAFTFPKKIDFESKKIIW